MNWETKFPLRIWQDGVPYLRGSIGDESEEWFVIDSGALGNSLQADVFDELLEQRQIQLGATSASMTVAGEMRGDRGKIAEFRVGRFMHEHLRFSRVNMSSVGLRYLSRFRVLFDFPNECLYLHEASITAARAPCHERVDSELDRGSGDRCLGDEERGWP